MKKKLSFLKIFISFLVLFNSKNTYALKLRKYEKNPTTFYKVNTIVNKVNKKILMTKLKNFVIASRPSRFPGTKGHTNAQKWIIDEIQKIKNTDDNSSTLSIEEFLPDIAYGKALFEANYKLNINKNNQLGNKEIKKLSTYKNSMLKVLDKLKSVKGQNLIWEKKGVSDNPKTLILGAHFDTIGVDKKRLMINENMRTPGADDNASGVIALLTLIEILEKLQLKHTIKIVFFDFQEYGNLGSRDFISKHDEKLKQNLEGFINVEMIGHDTKIFDTEKKLKNYRIYTRKPKHQEHLKDMKLAQQVLHPKLKAYNGLKLTINSNGQRNSDHSSFWEKGVPSILFTQNLESDHNEKRHHTMNDFPETINTQTYLSAFRYLASFVISWGFDISR